MNIKRKKIIEGMHAWIFTETKFSVAAVLAKKQLKLLGRSFTVHNQVLSSEPPGKRPSFLRVVG